MKRSSLRVRAGAMFGLCVLSFPLLMLLVPQLYGLGELSAANLLIIGCVILPLGIPFHLLGSSSRIITGAWRQIFYLPAMAISLVGTAFCEVAYYTLVAVEPTVSSLLIGAALPTLLCVGLTAILMLLPHRYAGITLGGALVSVISIAIFIVLWVKSQTSAETVGASFGFFELLSVLLTVIALYAACEEPGSPWLRFLSFASFGLLMVAGAVVLVILLVTGDGCDCDLDCCDGCDCGSGDGTARKRRRK